MSNIINKLRVLAHINKNKNTSEENIIGIFLGQEYLQLIPSALELVMESNGSYSIPLVLPSVLGDSYLYLTLTLHKKDPHTQTIKTTHKCEVNGEPFTQSIIPALEEIKSVIDFLIQTKYSSYEKKHTRKS